MRFLAEVGKRDGIGKEANECRVGKRFSLFSLFSEEACSTTSR